MSDVHPVRQRPELPPEQQFEILRELVARLWDQVWWRELPWYRRLGYWLQGFRAPIRRFYDGG